MSEIREQHNGASQQVERMLSNMETYLGYVPGYRRAHARGVSFRGMFEATSEARTLTTAEHLQGGQIPVVVRFSNGDGSPYFADRTSDKKGTVLGLAVRFELPSGGHGDVVGLNITTFPARRPGDFSGLASAQRKGLPTGLPNPIRLGLYLATHPQCVPGVIRILRAVTAESFATQSYHGLHAFWAVNGEGTRRAFRYHWIPETAEVPMSAEQDKLWPPQYLVSEIEHRVARGPVAWDLVFELGDPGDQTNDLTKAWPADRRRVTVGRMVVDRLHEDPVAADQIMYDPTDLPPGLEASDDPVLHFRSEVYVESKRRRADETKPEITSG
jgi:catalase